ncbi:glycosyltransferase [Rhizobium sp.]|jgi:sterol 3beta-glucosyltransferase|uniref:glycosyltransferase n=1 Tax=Rhizobium sp. TaxID=391 RepID=UPI000E9258A5|nr:glycosyltransferase [Rhizobium sp.]
MQIVILTIGTEGDVRPLVALGLGLKAEGHQVRVATDQSCEKLVVDHGLEFAPLNGDFMSWMRKDKSLQKSGLATLAMARAFQQQLLLMSQMWPEQGCAAAAGADLLIGNGMVFFLAAALGEMFNIPVIETQLVPTMPAEHPPIIPLPKSMQSLPQSVNVGLGHLTRQLIWHVYRPAYNQGVRPKLGLKPYPFWGPYYSKGFQHPKLLAYSPNLVEPRKTWPSLIQTTGSWVLEGRDAWEPPAELMRFLDAGPAPVYIGFGSMFHHDAASFTAMIRKAVDDAGKRVVLATGWGGLNLEPGAEQDKIMSIGHVPHDWLFPRMALAVHHGGAGTTHAATRAGIPSVVVPVFGDQPFWAGRLEKLGVAPPALPRETLTAVDLTKAIKMADNPTMRRRAADVGRRLQAEHGVQNAINALRAFGVLPA